MREQLGHVATSSPFSKSSYNKIKHGMVSIAFPPQTPAPKPPPQCPASSFVTCLPTTYVRAKWPSEKKRLQFFLERHLGEIPQKAGQGSVAFPKPLGRQK